MGITLPPREMEIIPLTGGNSIQSPTILRTIFGLATVLPRLTFYIETIIKLTYILWKAGS